MSLSDLAAAGSFVSGLAVVITLFFLLLQMRQANRNQRAVLNQGYYNRSTSNTQWFAEPARIALMVKVMSGETNFTPEEVTHLNYSLRVLLLGAQDAHAQYKSGLIDRMTYDNSALVVQTYLSRPPYRAIWLRMRSTIAAEFRSEIDKIFAELPIAAPREVSAQFQSDLQRVMAQTSSEVHAPVLSG